MSWRRPLIASLSRQTSVRAEGGAECQEVSDASRCRGFHATGMSWSSPAPHMAVRAQASTVCCCAKPNSAKARAGRQPTWRAGADSLVAHRSILSVHSGHQLLGTPRRAQPAVLRDRLLHRRPRKCGVVATAERPATQVSAHPAGTLNSRPRRILSPFPAQAIAQATAPRNSGCFWRRQLRSAWAALDIPLGSPRAVSARCV